MKQAYSRKTLINETIKNTDSGHTKTSWEASLKQHRFNDSQNSNLRLACFSYVTEWVYIEMLKLYWISIANYKVAYGNIVTK